MKKLTLKKYPLLVSIIASCIIIVASLFILGFLGLKLSVNLAGGSQLSITLADGANSKQYVSKISDIVSNNGYYVDSSFVEDKYLSTGVEGEFTTKCLIVNIASTDISDYKKNKIRTQISEALDLDLKNISEIEQITTSVKGKDVLFIGLAIGIVAIALFVFALFRYNVFAGLAFIVAFLHNIILYLAVLILTRVELSMMSLSMALVLTVLMSLVMVHIFERHREVTRLKLEEKMSVTERMISSEMSVIKPYAAIAAVTLLFCLLLLFVPVSSVKLAALSVLIALLVSVYTGLIIGPGTYASLLEIKDLSLKSTLSRNDTVNKQIKKKIKKNSGDAGQAN